MITPKVLGGEETIANSYSDPRQPLMDWLRQQDNPYFARAVVNRVWAGYFNVGIVEPPDDMNLANPPSNRELTRLPGRRVHSPRLRPEMAASRDLPQPHLPVELEAERDERSGHPQFQPCRSARLPAEVAYDAVINGNGRESTNARAGSEPRR